MISARRFIHSHTTHGGTQDNTGMAHRIADFSININPFPPHPAVIRAAQAVPIERYPNIRPLRLVQSLAKHTGLDTKELLVCNGTSEALLLISLVFLMENDAVIQFTPCYGEYAHVSSFMGAEVSEIPISLESPSINIPVVSDLLQRTKARICWFCNPTSPAGKAVDFKELQALAEVCTKRDCILVIDEAYANFLSKRPPMETLIANNYLILLRSMTKDYNLNALRLGYIAGNESIIHNIAAAQPPWSVNLLAENAGISALQEQAYYEETWKKTRGYRRALQEAITELGYHVLPSDANYFLFYDHLGSVASALLKNDILVRDCQSFGLNKYIRIGTSNEANNARLIKALKEITNTAAHTLLGNSL